MNHAVEMLNITKRFPGVIANNDITLKIEKGEVRALLGENGAGKSTLMSILFGLYLFDEGMIKINGVEVEITNPNDANALGIGMVHQHFKLAAGFHRTGEYHFRHGDNQEGLSRYVFRKRKSNGA